MERTQIKVGILCLVKKQKAVFFSETKQSLKIHNYGDWGPYHHNRPTGRSQHKKLYVVMCSLGLISVNFVPVATWF